MADIAHFMCREILASLVRSESVVGIDYGNGRCAIKQRNIMEKDCYIMCCVILEVIAKENNLCYDKTVQQIKEQDNE